MDHGPRRIKQDQIRREQKLTMMAAHAVLPKRSLTGLALACQRRGVNKFLLSVFGEPMLISDVLKRRGYKGGQIAVLQGQVSKFLALYLSALYWSWNLILKPRQILVLAYFYSFTGEALRSEAELAAQLKMPPHCVERTSTRRNRCWPNPITSVILSARFMIRQGKCWISRAHGDNRGPKEENRIFPKTQSWREYGGEPWSTFLK